MSDPAILRNLAALIASRRAERPENSYVVHLLDGGLPRLAAKIEEETAELLAAARHENLLPGSPRQALVHEAADVVFHLLVLLESLEVSWEWIEAELVRRWNVGGFQEKAARPK